MIIPHALLNPIAFKVQDPFVSIITCLEGWLLKNQPVYFEKEWPAIKAAYVRRLLGLAKNGAALRGRAHLAPTEDLGSTLLGIYGVIDHSVYFTSQYWRAFYYWLKNKRLNPCWPQFTEREAALAYSVLNEDEIAYLRSEAEKEWLDLYSDKDLIDKLFKKIRRTIYHLCYKRADFLKKYDPALYSMEDLQQYAIESVLTFIRNNDYLTRSLDWLERWSVRCADNALLNLIHKATAAKCSRRLEVTEAAHPMFGSTSYHRECYLSMLMVNQQHEESEFFSLLESARLFENKTVTESELLENNLCVKELLKLADPKINSYLRTICCGEHNPDFWIWFYYNEPTLAQRTAYIEENPEAIGPYLQRHLGLPTYQLTNFLRQHLPSLLEKLSDSPSKRSLLSA